jgi:hypothetical protein
MRNFLSLLLLVTMLVAIGCKQKNTDANSDLAPGMHTATVIEVKQTASYTYFQVFENDQKFWMATSSLDAKEGDVVYYTRAFEMKDFKSKELNKTFESIYFVEDASTEPIKVKQATSPGKINPSQVADLQVTKATDGITLEELFQDKKKYNGKEVTIRGLVVKYNFNIMGKNWAHIQDGTSSENNYDLTVTTNDTLAQGIVGTFKGVIVLDKDFGAGYKYDVLMEDAKVSETENYNFQ